MKQVLLSRYRQIAVDQNLTEEYAAFQDGFVTELLDEMTKFALYYVGTGHILILTVRVFDFWTKLKGNYVNWCKKITVPYFSKLYEKQKGLNFFHILHKR